MITIKIEEIENGFVVEFFDTDGPSELDKTIFRDSFNEVLKEVSTWFKKQKEG